MPQLFSKQILRRQEKPGLTERGNHRAKSLVSRHFRPTSRSEAPTSSAPNASSPKPHPSPGISRRYRATQRKPHSQSSAFYPSHELESTNTTKDHLILRFSGIETRSAFHASQSQSFSRQNGASTLSSISCATHRHQHTAATTLNACGIMFRMRNALDSPLINSSDPSFELELHRRRAFYADKASQIPSDLAELEEAINAPCGSTSLKSNDDSLISFQRRLKNSCNEAAIVQGVMPQLVPIEELLDDEAVITVPNQQWDKECSLRIPTTAQYRIPPPKPDQTIGLSSSSLSGYENSLAYLAHKARPIKCLPSLAFPLVTVEAKGDRGQNVCRSQNLHNAAVILHQLLRLWEDTGSANELYYKALACTISITTQTCAISHFWLEPSPSGSATVRGRLFKSWSLNMQDANTLDEVVSSVRNAINFAIARGSRLITERLEALEQLLEATPRSCCSPSCRKRKFVDVEPCDDDSDDSIRPHRLRRVRSSSSRRSSGSSRRSSGRSSSSWT